MIYIYIYIYIYIEIYISMYIDKGLPSNHTHPLVGSTNPQDIEQ